MVSFEVTTSKLFAFFLLNITNVFCRFPSDFISEGKFRRFETDFFFFFFFYILFNLFFFFFFFFLSMSHSPFLSYATLKFFLLTFVFYFLGFERFLGR